MSDADNSRNPALAASDKWPRFGGAIRAALICAVAGIAALAAFSLQGSGTQKASAVSTAPPAPSAGLPTGRIPLRSAERLQVGLPDGSIRAIDSLLDVEGPQEFGSFVWNEAGAGSGPVWVRVDLGAQTISVFRGGDEIGTAVILYGTTTKPTPLGWFAVKEKQRDYYSRSYDAPMPWMLRLTDDGVALHASHVRAGHATHGCIGTPDEFASRLFRAMDRGGQVLIVDSRPATATAGRAKSSPAH